MNKEELPKETKETIVPQKIIYQDRRRSDRVAEHYTDAHWHVSKAVSLSTLIAIFMLFAGGFLAFRDGIADINAAIAADQVAIKTMDEKHNTRMDRLEELIAVTSQDRISRTETIQMLDLRDEQIKNLSKSMDLMRKEHQLTNKILSSIAVDLAALKGQAKGKNGG